MPPSNRFPILRLPMLPLELVIKDLTPLDIFILALTSNRIHKHLKRNRTKLEKFQLKRNYDYIDFHLLPFNALDYRIQLGLRRKEWAGDNQNAYFDLKIKGKQYKARCSKKDSSVLELYEIHENPEVFLISILEETIPPIFELLSNIIAVQKVRFGLISKEVILPFVSKFSGIQSLNLYRFCSFLTSEELTNLLENLSVKNFKLNWGVGRGVEYRKSLRYPKMTIHRARWLTIDCLLNMDCVVLAAHDVSLTVEDLKRFIQHWLDGGLEKLRCIELHWRFEQNSFQPILDNIKKKPLIYVENKMRCLLKDSAFEIERSDGRRAGVYADKVFFLQVL